MKMKKIGPRGGHTSKILPYRSANAGTGVLVPFLGIRHWKEGVALITGKFLFQKERLSHYD